MRVDVWISLSRWVISLYYFPKWLTSTKIIIYEMCFHMMKVFGMTEAKLFDFQRLLFLLGVAHGKQISIIFFSVQVPQRNPTRSL